MGDIFGGEMSKKSGVLVLTPAYLDDWKCLMAVGEKSNRVIDGMGLSGEWTPGI